MTSPLPHLTLVIPVYNEEEVLPELCQRLGRLFDGQPGVHWSALLVNDGSRDRSGSIMRQMNAEDPRIKVVHLWRNFGHQLRIV